MKRTSIEAEHDRRWWPENDENTRAWERRNLADLDSTRAKCVPSGGGRGGIGGESATIGALGPQVPCAADSRSDRSHRGGACGPNSEQRSDDA
jgi:hypothetical protein